MDKVGKPNVTIMGKYNSFAIHRDWIEQAHILCPNRDEFGELLIALVEYALDDKVYRGKSKEVKAFLLSVTKLLNTQRRRYAQREQSRATMTKTMTKTMTNTMTTSEKDEEEETDIFL